MGADKLVGANWLLAPGAVGLEFGVTLRAAGGVGQQGRTTFRAEVLFAGRALIVTYLNQLPTRGAPEFLVPGCRRAAGRAMIFVGVQLAQTLPAQDGLARGAGGKGWVEM